MFGQKTLPTAVHRNPRPSTGSRRTRTPLTGSHLSERAARVVRMLSLNQGRGVTVVERPLEVKEADPESFPRTNWKVYGTN